MRKLLLFILLISSCVSYAQNYQCLQAGVKHYFTNKGGYLRGIRIDSVKTFVDSTVYYPFHTPRGSWSTGLGGFHATLDEKGGSWLGKRVVQLNNGTFLFDNLWGDTVCIQTQAGVGDSWIFYSDTSKLFYQGILIGVDTMTVSGLLDSVKRILIRAYNSAGLLPYDPLDSFQIILSKNQGFVEVFDLYTFPYHKPDSVAVQGLDFYMDHSRSTAEFFSSSLPSKSNSIFKLVTFINPATNQLYECEVGDVHERVYYARSAPFFSVENQSYYLDTVISKSILPHSVVYTYSGLQSHRNGYGFDISYYTHSYITSDSTYLFDRTKMPEEAGSNLCNYYYPDDSSWCMKSPLYSSGWVYFHDGKVHTNKIGFGEIYNDVQTGDPLRYGNQLIYSSKGGSPCGVYFPVSVAIVNQKNSLIKLDPNPASIELTVTATHKIYNIVVLNTVGQSIYAREYNSEKVQINIADLPTGMYFIKINNSEVRKFMKQ